MSEDKMREEFEHYAREKGIPLARYRDTDYYDCVETMDQWLGFRAGYPAGLERAAKEVRKHWYKGATDTAIAIRALAGEGMGKREKS